MNIILASLGLFAVIAFGLFLMKRRFDLGHVRYSTHQQYMRKHFVVLIVGAILATYIAYHLI